MELVRKTLTFSGPERIPRQFLIWNEAGKKLPDGIHRLKEAYPEDLVFCPTYYFEPQARGLFLKDDIYFDEWGCRYQVRPDGSAGMLFSSPLSDRSDFRNFSFPEKRLNLDLDKINNFCKHSDRFVLAPALVRPFEQLQALRSPERAFLDLHQQSRSLFKFLGKLHHFFLKELTAWAKTEVDALVVADDWGSQSDLLISPALWRQVFKPLYADYGKIARDNGKFFFFHSDGFILEIIEDLIETGVQALNLQLSCYHLVELSRLINSRITLWGGFDLQMINSLPLDRLREKVILIKKLFVSAGGLIAALEIGKEIYPENIQLILSLI